jgi:F-type H+-transporting ATPase subunit a
LTRNLRKVGPSKVQILLEFGVGTLNKMVNDMMGKRAIKELPFIVCYLGSLFLFFMVSNIIGLVGLKSPTTDIDTTLAWALITVGMLYYLGVKTSGIGYFKGLLHPIPLMLPLNIIGEFARPISLTFRPFGNILGGTVIMALLYQFLGYIGDRISEAIFHVRVPFLQLLIPVPLHMYFDLFAGILQAFIFIVLTMVFVGGAADDGEHA